MLKNKEGLIRSGWKITLVFAIIFGLSYLEGHLFNSFAINQVFALGVTQISLQSLYDQWDWINLFFHGVILIVVPVIAWNALSKRRLADMGLGRFRMNRKLFASGLLFGVISITTVFIAIMISGYIGDWIPILSVHTMIPLMVFSFIGFFGDVISIGYFMSVLRQTKSIPFVMIISAVMFSLLHMIYYGFCVVSFINTALISLLFAHMYIKSGSLWMPIGYNITWSSLKICMFGLPLCNDSSRGLIKTQYASNNIFIGGVFGPDGGLAATALIVLGFMFVRRYFKNASFQFLDMDTPSALKALYLQFDCDI